MTTEEHTTPGASRPSGLSDERVMRCSRCEGEWKAPAKRPERPVHCPYCNVHICGCGCGEEMTSYRRDAIYATEAHGKRLKRAEDPASPDVPPIRTVAEARAIQEDAKGHWSMIVREGILEVLKATGGYHADDLDHLGIPDEHRNIIGSQTAKLVNQKWIEEAGRRKSVLPSRNGAKSGIYRLSKLGRMKLAGVGADCPKGAETAFTPCLPVSVDSGESGAGSRGQAGGAANPFSCRPANATPGVASPEPSGTETGAEEEQQGEGTAEGHHAVSAPSTGRLKPHGAPTSSGAGSGGALPGLEQSSYERMQDAA